MQNSSSKSPKFAKQTFAFVGHLAVWLHSIKIPRVLTCSCFLWFFLNFLLFVLFFFFFGIRIIFILLPLPTERYQGGHIPTEIKFLVFSLSGKSKNQIPCFPCAVATLDMLLIIPSELQSQMQRNPVQQPHYLRCPPGPNLLQKPEDCSYIPSKVLYKSLFLKKLCSLEVNSLFKNIFYNI